MASQEEDIKTQRIPDTIKKLFSGFPDSVSPAKSLPASFSPSLDSSASSSIEAIPNSTIPRSKSMQEKSVIFEDSVSEEEKVVIRRKSRMLSENPSRRRKSGSVLKEDSIESYNQKTKPKVIENERRRLNSIQRILESKAELLLKVNRNGVLQQRYFEVSADGTELSWSSNMFFKRADAKIVLASVLYMKVGPRTERFLDYDWEAEAPWWCFSLVTESRTVDIQCSSQEQFIKWFLGLQALIPLSRKHITKARVLWHQAILKSMQIASRQGDMNVYQVWDALVAQARKDVAVEKKISNPSTTEVRFEASQYLASPKTVVKRSKLVFRENN